MAKRKICDNITISEEIKRSPESVTSKVYSKFQRLFIHPELTPKVVEKSIDSLLAGFQPATHGGRDDYKKLSPLNMTLTDEELKQNTTI